MMRGECILLCGALVLSGGCSDFDPPAQAAPDTTLPAHTTDAGADYRATPPLPADADDGTPTQSAFEHAAIGADYAFVPDTTDHAITLVHLETGAHAELRAGAYPRRVATAAGQDLAITLDDLQAKAHVIRVVAEAAEVVELEVAPGLNALLISPGGAHALLYHDPAAPAASSGRPDGTLASVVSLTGTPTVTQLDLGGTFDALALTDAPARLYLRHGTRVSRFDLELPDTQPAPVDVGTPSAMLRWAPAGHRAVAFHVGDAVIDVADLRSGRSRRLWLESLAALHPTADADAGVVAEGDLQLADATLSADGARLWLALVDRDLLVDVRLPEALDDPAAASAHTVPMDGEVSLSLSATGDRVAVLQGQMGARSVGVFPAGAPDAAIAVELPAAAVDVAFGGTRGDLLFTTASGFGLVSTALGDARFQPTTATPIGFDWAGDTLFVLAAHAGHALPGAGVLRMDPASLRAEHIRVDSPARYLQTIADGAAVIIDQRHPDGRLTRVSADGSESVSITGFHVDDRVKE